MTAECIGEQLTSVIRRRNMQTFKFLMIYALVYGCVCLSFCVLSETEPNTKGYCLAADIMLRDKILMGKQHCEGQKNSHKKHLNYVPLNIYRLSCYAQTATNRHVSKLYTESYPEILHHSSSYTPWTTHRYRRTSTFTYKSVSCCRGCCVLLLTSSNGT